VAASGAARSRETKLYARALGPFAYRPVALLEELEAFPSTGGVTGAGVPPEDPSEQVVLLDSAGGGPRLAERSLLAWRPHAHLWSKNGHTVVSSRSGGRGWRTTIGPEDPFSALRGELARCKVSLRWLGGDLEEDLSWVGAYGLIAYDSARAIEVLPDNNVDDLQIPDLDVIFPTRWVCFDHRRGRAVGVADSIQGLEEIEEVVSASARAPRVRLEMEVAGHSTDASIRTESNMQRDAFEAIVARGREYVWAGDVFQTNLSQRLEMSYEGESSLLYRVLRTLNPSPFAGYMRLSGYELYSSSPERLVRLHGRVADTRPIAGTRRRGKDFAEDGLLADDLNLDPKERAEHIMLVDLERNDLGRVSEYGSVHVDELMVNERYSHVIHIVSNVTGILQKGKDAVDLVRAMFPGGTITGCPKVRCMEIIDELENVRRGAYTGSFGYFGYGGDTDMNIIIRTLVRVGDQTFVQAGGGVVADSVPEKEYMETLSKAEAVVQAVGEATREHQKRTCGS